MKPLLAAGAASGAIGLVAWSVFAVMSAVAFGGVEDLAGLGMSLILMMFGLVLFVLVPLVAGFLGGLASRDVRAVLGSTLGYLAVLLGVALFGGAALPSTEGVLAVGIVSAALVVAGHVPGALLRPRARTA